MGRTKRRRRNRRRNPPSQALDHEEAAVNLLKFMTGPTWKPKKTLKLRNFPETGRGVATTIPIHPNDILISIPYELMVTYTTLQSMNYPQLISPSSELKIHDFLAVFLALESHKNTSPWTSYINSLPVSLPPLPWLLPLEQIELLPSTLRSAAMKSRRLLEESWERVKKSIRRSCVLDMDTFTWAFVMVNTRGVYVNSGVVREMCDVIDRKLSDEPCMALCPYLDMFNHSHEARTEAELIYFEGQLFYQLTTLTSTQAHGQVFISYGAHDNLKLVNDYGFFIPRNSLDCAYFRMERLVAVLGLNLNTYQYKFIVEHGLDRTSEVYIAESGPSFNLKAILHVASEAECKKLASLVYGESCYPKGFQKKLTDICKKLLQYKIDRNGVHLRSFEHLEEFSDRLVLVDNYFKYRKQFLTFLFDCNCK